MSLIRIRFVANHALLSDIIRALTGSCFSHVEFGTPEGTWIGALGDGIKERPANYCNPFREYVYEIPCTMEEQSQLLAWARSKIGTKYNYADIMGLLFQNRTWHSPNRFICSQFCTEGLLLTFRASRVLNVMMEWAYRITPETLHLSPILTGNLKRKRG